MPIIIAPTGAELTIQKVLVDEKTKRHLESLGILPNSKIMVVSVSNGNVICLVKNVRIALNKETATKIIVA